MRKILVTTIIILGFLTACQPAPVPTHTFIPSATPLQPTPTPIPWKPVSLSDVQSKATTFEKLRNAMVEAWNSRDNQALDGLFAEDAIMIDESFGDHAVGMDAIADVLNNMAMMEPNWKADTYDQFINREGGISVDNLWDLSLGSQTFGMWNTLTGVDWLETKNGRVSSWTVFYGLDSLEKMSLFSSQLLAQRRSLLSAYQSAWSSGDAQRVASLYTSDAVREDSLFGESRVGRDSISSYAQWFHAWFPEAQWTLWLGFGVGVDSPRTGGLYFIKVNDLNGQPCGISAAVLLQTAEDKIALETLFYEPVSLISCGWAR